MSIRPGVLTLTIMTSLIACSRPASLTMAPSTLAQVSIIDHSSGPGSLPDVVILQASLTAADLRELEDLCALAASRFPDGAWQNFGPDSSYREIVLSCGEQTFILRSWHPIFEKNPTVVAASYGITSLDGLTRDEFLARDDAAYVVKRGAFDEMERELRRRFGSGSPSMKTVAPSEGLPPRTALSPW